MSVPELRCRQGRNEVLIFRGPLNKLFIPKLQVLLLTDDLIVPSVSDHGCVQLTEQNKLQRPQNVNDSCLGQKEVCTDLEPACLPSQHGTLASRPTALGTGHSAQCRVALCIMESAGEAFDLNCMPTADSILVSAIVYC